MAISRNALLIKANLIVAALSSRTPFKRKVSITKAVASPNHAGIDSRIGYANDAIMKPLRNYKQKNAGTSTLES